MSKNQLNYANDNSVGKRIVAGLMAPSARGKHFRKVKGLDFETVQLGGLDTIVGLGAATGTEDLLGKGNNAQLNYYLSTIISGNVLYLYTATDEDGTGMADFSTVTISPFSSSGSLVSSIDVNSGKMVLTDAGVVALGVSYLFASYSYLIPKGNFDVERRVVEDSTYIYQSGVASQWSHAVGDPDDENRDGHFKYDRLGLLTNGAAQRTGDVFVVRDKVKGNTFTAFGANLNVFDANYWEEVNPIVEAADDTTTKDASLREADVVSYQVVSVSGQDVNVVSSVAETLWGDDGVGGERVSGGIITYPTVEYDSGLGAYVAYSTAFSMGGNDWNTGGGIAPGEFGSLWAGSVTPLDVVFVGNSASGTPEPQTLPSGFDGTEDIWAVMAGDSVASRQTILVPASLVYDLSALLVTLMGPNAVDAIVESVYVASAGTYTLSPSNELGAESPYTLYLVCPARNLALPIDSSNFGTTKITIVSGYSPAALQNGDVVYVRKKKAGNYEIKNSVFTY